MLAEARRSGLPAEAALVAGSAECLPFADQSFDAAWMSMVIHHIADRHACTRELARVLVPSGRVYVRGFFSGTSRLDWLQYFPGRERALARFPSVEDVAAAFAHADFSVLRLDEVHEPPRSVDFALSWIRKMRHADTLLTALSDDEIDVGLAAIAAAGTTEIGGSLHLLTFAAPE
jgi:SAM-dependent methyltransferase